MSSTGVSGPFELYDGESTGGMIIIIREPLVVGNPSAVGGNRANIFQYYRGHEEINMYCNIYIRRRNMYFSILYSNILHILFTPIYFSVTLEQSLEGCNM